MEKPQFVRIFKETLENRFMPTVMRNDTNESQPIVNDSISQILIGITQNENTKATEEKTTIMELSTHDQ